MVEIQINEKYAIRSDSRQWMVATKSAKKDKKTGDKSLYWEPVGYYPNLEMAVKSLSERLIRESDATTWEELKNAVVGVVGLMSRKFPSLEVTVNG